MSVIIAYKFLKFDEVINPKRQGWNEWSIAVLPYGPELRRSRQKLHQFLQQSIVPEYHSFQEQSSCRLAELLLSDPNNFMDVVKPYAEFVTNN